MSNFEIHELTEKAINRNSNIIHDTLYGEDYETGKNLAGAVADLASANVAAPYDDTVTYAIGQYCLYEGDIYRCIAITTGAFDSTAWVQIVVTGEFRRVVELLSAEYSQLTPAEQNNGTIYIKTDEETTAADIPYSAGVSVADKIDELTTYSTTERVVGKWTDGKTVYEKIIDVPMPTTANVMESTPHNIANIDTLVSYFAFDVYPNGTIVPMPTYLWTSGGQSASFYASLDKTNTNILCGADRTGHIGRFFIRYTKT